MSNSANQPAGYDDATAMLLAAIVALALGHVLVAVVPPGGIITGRVWLFLSVSVMAVLFVGLMRRDLHVVRFVLFAAVSIAALVVGLCYPLYMAIVRPRWLFSVAALICYAYAIVGGLALWANRSQRAE